MEEKLGETKQDVMEHMTRELTKHKQEVTSNIQSMEHQLDNKNTKIEDTMVQLVLRVNEIEQNGNQTCVIREDKNTNHEVPHMKGYIRNPMEYLNRMQEYLHSTKENRWERIKLMLDQGFHKMKDYWWDAVRNALNSYQEFVESYKNKYWIRSVSYTHLDVYKRQV